MDIQTIPREVMRCIEAFTKKPPKVRLTKIGCVNGHEPIIPIGHVVIGSFTTAPEIGNSFNLKNAKIIEGGNSSGRNKLGHTYEYWCTSIIEKVLPDNTFETQSAVYKWQII